MAKMVTRTMRNTVCDLFMVNVEDKTTFEQSVVLAGEFKNEKELNKGIENLFDGEPVKCVYVINQCVEEKLYGMEESLFLQYAKELPPRSAKTEKDTQ